MTGPRLLRILAQLSSGDGPEPNSARLCEVSAEVTAMSGAGIMLMSGDAPTGSVCNTDAVSALIEEAQYGLGGGPCVDAYRQARPVLEPDLADANTTRWPAFTPLAVEAATGPPWRSWTYNEGESRSSGLG